MFVQGESGQGVARCFMGLVGLQDPPRPEVAPAIRRCKQVRWAKCGQVDWGVNECGQSGLIAEEPVRVRVWQTPPCLY